VGRAAAPISGRRRVLIVSSAVVVLALVIAVGWTIRNSGGSTHPDEALRSPSVGPNRSTGPNPSTGPPSTRVTPTRSRSTQAVPRPRGHTPGGMWWGVDSTGPITTAAIANVEDWYQGGRPQFWGRYVNGHYGVTRHELAFARQHGIYVALLVTDANCSACAGGDICGNDETTGQARTDAHDAIAAARRVGVQRGALLVKDTEQISSCRGEPSADYLLSWYRTVHRSGYRTGFYGNVHGQDYDFPRDYCTARHRSARFAADVVLDMNENEPRLGAPKGTTGPHNAPAFKPQFPNCSARSTTAIWQYGESTDSDNYADLDQARPDTAGLLAPDGTVTGA
jgi:hypothetical protein